MRDFVLTFNSEIEAITALPEYRTTSEDGEHWTGNIIPNCTRWITRPQYDEDGVMISPPETVPGWHCIIRAESLPEAAQPYIVTDPGDIEPVPAGGLLKPSVPESVTALQGLLAIDRAGFAGQYEAWANDPARTFSERAFISKAETWKRDDPTLLNAATALGITESQLDELFILAATL